MVTSKVVQATSKSVKCYSKLLVTERMSRFFIIFSILLSIFVITGFLLYLNRVIIKAKINETYEKIE